MEKCCQERVSLKIVERAFDENSRNANHFARRAAGETRTLSLAAIGGGASDAGAVRGDVAAQQAAAAPSELTIRPSCGNQIAERKEDGSSVREIDTERC
jgi:hypothetical protein